MWLPALERPQFFEIIIKFKYFKTILILFIRHHGRRVTRPDFSSHGES